ncbi:MAG: macro domain-containing protein [Desulfohalobiaceae bacterium]|nr:macro domain-containing protein [Desulfohalobiaceae bacterium]
MSKRHIQGLTVECVQGDIANQPDVDAVANAANAQLMPGGGVAGALHKAAGPGLAEECRPLAPINPGHAVITGAHNLPNSHVIHCLGPVHGRDEPSEELLSSCYRRALELAEEKGLTSVAFPSISTGAFGFPMERAARIAVRTVVEQAPHLSSVKLVRFVLFSKKDQSVFAHALEERAD